MSEENEIKRLRKAFATQNDYIEQVLGKALNYPWYMDDQVNFPGADESNGVFIGIHTTDSIADAAAAKIEEQEAKLIGLYHIINRLRFYRREDTGKCILYLDALEPIFQEWDKKNV